MGRDHTPKDQGRSMADEPGRGGAAPAPAPRGLFPIALPSDWPEVITYRAARRLFAEGNDAVWVLIRSGQSLHQDLDAVELSAHAELPGSTWERWFRLGWARIAAEEEGG